MITLPTEDPPLVLFRATHFYVLSQGAYSHDKGRMVVVVPIDYTLKTIYALINTIANQSNGHKLKTLKEEIDSVQDSIKASAALKEFSDHEEWSKIHRVMMETLRELEQFRRWQRCLDKKQKFLGFWIIRNRIKAIQGRTRDIADYIELANLNSRIAQELHMKEEEDRLHRQAMKRALTVFKQCNKQMEEADKIDVQEQEKAEAEIVKALADRDGLREEAGSDAASTTNATFVSAQSILLSEEASVSGQIEGLYEMLREGSDSGPESDESSMGASTDGGYAMSHFEGPDSAISVDVESTFSLSVF
ncbi:hypothetical protein DENSPDRAFT_509604 [Dentipellis sp. KUC8613]|nr:hypothetical protein DENSPDRAFT_509604 [Dentipellis sp. KUC8613]